MKLFRKPKSPSADQPRLRSRWQKTIFIASAAYVLLLLATWLIARYVGDRWWVATLVLFGPRWVPAVPLVFLLIVAGIFDRRSLWVLFPGLLLTLFGLLGFCMPVAAWTSPVSSGPTLRVLTCNIHHSHASTEPLADLIAREHPDVVVLEEYSRSFSPEIFTSGVWNIKATGEFCLASRYPVTYSHLLPGSHRGAFAVLVPGGEIDLFAIHLSSPHYPLSDAVHGEAGGADEVEVNSSARLLEAQDLARRARDSGSDVVLAGDFNLPSDSPIFRQSLGQLSDAFADGGFGFGFTYYHDSLPLTRIDHIMYGPDWKCLHCWVAPDIGSPHRPVIAELQRIRPVAPSTAP